MFYPHPCVVDSDETVLIADRNNHRLQLMDRKGGFRVVKGVGVEYPRMLLLLAGICLFYVVESLLAFVYKGMIYAKLVK